MKLVILVLAALLGQAFGLGENTNALMDTSVHYQEQATLLQNDINNHLIMVRQTVAEVLQANMNGTILQTKQNSDRILGIFSQMHEKMDKLVQDDCYEDLVELAEGIIKITGFKIGNVLTEHDANVTIALGNAEEIVRKFDVMSTEVQRVVHKAHIKSNVFKNPELVSQKYIAAFENFKAQWDEVRPQISEIILELRSSFTNMLVNLGSNFGAMQKSFDMSVNLFESDAVVVCVDYAKSARMRAFSGTMMKGKFKFFDPEVYLPDYELPEVQLFPF